MPTATTISQWSLTNWGPLTTTFSASPSCATAGISFIAPKSNLGQGMSADCAVATVGAACYPSGSQLDAAESKAFTQPGLLQAGYFSPGLACPSGWQTVGIAAKGSSGVSASGIFVASAHPDSLLFNPVVNVFTAALDAGETAAACCPSSMTALTEGVCVSTLPKYSPTTVCDRIIPDDDVTFVPGDITYLGQHTTVSVVSFVGSKPITSTSTRTFAPSQTSDYVGISLMPMVMLVHRDSDTSGQGGGGGSGGGSGSGNPSDGSGKNAAGSGRLQACVQGARSALGFGLLAIIVTLMTA
ncbi:hypothetical protein QBC47DRAFT_129662 [Echria macrotheca]|uniref:Uncharacterized protein n=1 Tax=Echria macrotheca TaxID=438768 RepID=A0AAJ0F3W3_9PEZI|nr:hypothetical protein QBC47DRAFT_129662 [Echria macrotheca]